MVSLVEHVSHQASGSERPHTAEVNLGWCACAGEFGRQHGGFSATKAAKLCSRQEHLLIKSRRLVRLGAYLLGEIVQAFRKSLWHFQPVAYETAVTLVSLVSVSQFVPRMIPSQKLDSPASALISSHGLNLQPHYPLSRDASSERAPAWLPRIEFPWRITFGAVVTFAVAVCFKTPEFQVVAARKYVDRQSRIAP